MKKLSVDGILLKAKSHVKKGEIEAAQKLYQVVLQVFPKNKRAQRGLAALNKSKQSVTTKDPPQDMINQLINLYNQGQLIKVAKQAQALIKQYPEAFFVWNILGAAHKGLGKTLEASEAFKKVTELNPTYADGFNNLGTTLKEQSKLEEAIEAYSKALAIKPDYAEAYFNMGNALKDLDKLDEAIEAYKKTLLLNSDYAEAHRNLSSLIKYKPEDTQVAVVGEIIQRSNLNYDDRCHLLFAFAKMNEDLGNFDVAFENYVTGGKLRKKLLLYDLKQDERTFDQIRNRAPKLKELSLNMHLETAPHTPIFILGMPRSGTTLVEQIISCHSKVHGAGELTFVGRFAYPLDIGNQIISSDSTLKFRRNYLNELEKVSHGKHFVTDKMPQNFLHIGLILKALPEAKVIHVKRDPAATCWSNFKHFFSNKGLGFSFNLNDTVQYFKMYQDLMDFWEQQYGAQIYHLDYERLTIEQEPETKKLIKHLGLDWEDVCLSPQNNKRRVITASQQQVREKVYTDSSQAWRKFEPYLNGLFDEFELSSLPPLK